MKTAFLLVSALIAIVVVQAWAPTAHAGRSIVVNGQVLTGEQIAVLDRATCTHVPSGRYWLLPSGARGYEGYPVVAGFVGDQCREVAATPPRRKSLSERGLLYGPGELLR